MDEKYPGLTRAMSISGAAAAISAMTNTELDILWDALMDVPQGGLVVEVGCQLGRSSSLIIQAARERDFHSIHIDPYLEHPEHAHIWLDIQLMVDGPFVLLRMTTEKAWWYLSRLGKINLAFIDGNHLFEGVRTDLLTVASQIVPGGILLAHDCGHVHFPGVREEIDQFTIEGWRSVGIYDSLGMWQKL